MFFYTFQTEYGIWSGGFLFNSHVSSSLSLIFFILHFCVHCCLYFKTFKNIIRLNLIPLYGFPFSTLIELSFIRIKKYMNFSFFFFGSGQYRTYWYHFTNVFWIVTISLFGVQENATMKNDELFYFICNLCWYGIINNRSKNYITIVPFFNLLKCKKRGKSRAESISFNFIE